MPKKASSRTPAKPLYREKVEPRRATGYLDTWWTLQKPYCGYFSDEEDARLQAIPRNAIIMEIQGIDPIGIGDVLDYWRRDNGNPIPAQWTTEKPSNAFDTEHNYFTSWWYMQKLYVGMFATEGEAKLQCMSRNGLFVDIIGDVSIGRVEDYWRRDDSGKPMPAEWLTARFKII